MHWTGGGGTVAGVEATLRHRHLGVEYVMDREGHIVETGGPGAQHIRDETIYGTPLGKSLGLTSKNTAGMEIIADPTNPRHPLPYTKAQIKSAVEFMRRPENRDLPVYGHGEIQASKQRTEGLEIAEAVRADRAAGAAPVARRRLLGQPHVTGHHPATVGRAQSLMFIEAYRRHGYYCRFASRERQRSARR